MTPRVDAGRAVPRTVGRVLVRQTVAVLFLMALFAGLITNRRKAAILFAGLFVAGPVVTLLLPYVRLPRFFPPARSLGRWILAMGISLAISWLILLRFESATEREFLVTVIALAVAAPIFRLLLDAASGPLDAGDAASRPIPPSAVSASTIVLMVLVSLTVPEPAWADNCFGEGGECARKAFWSSLSMVGAALGALGLGMWSPDGTEWNIKYGPATISWGGPAAPPAATTPASNAPPPDGADFGSAAPAESPPTSPTPRPPGVHGPLQ